jgi:hypothetical protein
MPVAQPDPPQVAAAEAAAVEKGGYVPPVAVEPPAARTVVVPPPVPLPPAPQEAARPAAKTKARMPSLFERVNLASRLMRRDEPEEPRPAPARAPQPQRLGAPDPADRISTASREEDTLDIPAFLRRQAN